MPEAKSEDRTGKQMELKYATISKDPPNVSVEYTGADSRSEQKAEKQMTATKEYSTFNGYPPNVEAYTVDKSEKQYTLTDETTTVAKDPFNGDVEHTIVVTHDQACPLEMSKSLAEQSVEVLKLAVVSAGSDQQELEQKQARSSDVLIDNESHATEVKTGNIKDMTGTIRADEYEAEAIQNRKENYGKHKRELKLTNQPIFEPKISQSTKPLGSLDSVESDQKRLGLENVAGNSIPVQMESKMHVSDSKQKSYIEEKNKQKQSPKIEIKQQKVHKTIIKQPQVLIVKHKQHKALREKNKQHKNPMVMKKQQSAPKEENKQQQALKEEKKGHQQDTENEATQQQAVIARSKQQKRIKLKKKQLQVPDVENEHDHAEVEMQHQLHLQEENKSASIYNSKEALANKSIDDTLPTDLLDDCHSVEETTADITIQSIAEKNQKITKCKPVKSVESKRYLKVFRLLSSALGYSWSYREVWRKKKQFKLMVDAEGLTEEPFEQQHIPNVLEPKRKLNVSAKNPERLEKCEKSKGITSATGSETKHKHGRTKNSDKQRNTAPSLGSSRVHPYCKYEQIFKRKGMPSYKHKTRWTDSKF